MSKVTLKTVEPQYSRCIDVQEQYGLTQLGIMSNQTWHDDPKRLVFLLARYKFVAKMLQGRKRVVEVGSADAFGTRIVQQHVGHVTAADVDPVFVEDVRARMNHDWKLTAIEHDILESPFDQTFDAAYSLDLLEHIDPENEHAFIRNIQHSLDPYGVLILGSPTIHSQPYASPPSRAGHVNCKDYEGMKSLLEEYFYNVFIFSMNDEVVHTGFSKMANYFLALACAIRR